MDTHFTTGSALRVIIGHAVNFFLLLRPAMACIDRCYVIIFDNFTSYWGLPTDVLKELSLIQGLLPMAGIRLGTPCPHCIRF